LLVEGPDIESLLVRVRDEYGANARIISAERVRVGGFAGFFARQRYEVSVELDDAGQPPAPPPTAVPLTAVAWPRETPLTDAGAMPATVDALMALADANDSASLDLPPVPVTVSTQSDNFSAVLAGLRHRAGSVTADPVRAYQPPVLDYPPVAAADLDLRVPPESTSGAGAMYAGLRSLGLPEHLALTVAGPDRYAALVRTLRSLPPALPLPDRAGAVLVIVGPARAALPVAAELARSLSTDPGAVLLAAPDGPSDLGTARWITGPADAGRRAPALHGCDVPTVVVVDLPLDVSSARWARSIIDALGATSVWTLVDATDKTRDVAAQLRALGTVDALVVHATAATADPATVLELGLPIALLDGRAASPQAWAGLLLERLDGTP